MENETEKSEPACECNLHLEDFDLWQRCDHCGKKHGFVTEIMPPDDEKDGPPADDPLPVCEEHEVIKKLESMLRSVRNGKGVAPKFAKDLSIMVDRFEAVINLEIRSNNAMVRECCPVCYDGHKDSDSPYWIFSDNEGICHNCAETYASDLLDIVKAANAYHWLRSGHCLTAGHRMETLEPVLSDKEKAKLWGEGWKEKLTAAENGEYPF